MNIRRLCVLTAFLALFLVIAAYAETTVVEVKKEDFPYDQTVRIYVDEGKVYLECTDEYLDYGRKKIDPKELAAGLEKLLEWMNLNKTVKAKVTKRVDTRIEGRTWSYSWPEIEFHGLESGGSFAFVMVGETCTVYQSHAEKLLLAISNELAEAHAEDAKNKEDLFQ